MCETCGCGDSSEEVKIFKPGKDVENHNEHSHHSHSHDKSHEHQHLIDVQKDILDENRMLAERNRGYFEAKNIKAYNVVSSPGSGKTTLLESTLKALNGKKNISVIEGDQQTDNDARRIESAGAPVIQINTGNACHLDAHMVHHALQELNPVNDSLLFIENVGNLVCPALFDLGEKHRVVIFSVTEGEDKPLKYPNMFHSSDICLISKTDLLPYLEFDIAKAKENALKINHKLIIIELSVKSGDGMDLWLDLLT
jgi:hydrogenase nickel incorporation protein HypB